MLRSLSPVSLGVLCALAAMAAFSTGDALIKALGGSLSTFEIGFFSTVFSFLPAVFSKPREERWRRHVQAQPPGADAARRGVPHAERDAHHLFLRHHPAGRSLLPRLPHPGAGDHPLGHRAQGGGVARSLGAGGGELSRRAAGGAARLPRDRARAPHRLHLRAGRGGVADGDPAALGRRAAGDAVRPARPVHAGRQPDRHGDHRLHLAIVVAARAAADGGRAGRHRLHAAAQGRGAGAGQPGGADAVQPDHLGPALRRAVLFRGARRDQLGRAWRRRCRRSRQCVRRRGAGAHCRALGRVPGAAGQSVCG